MSLRQARRTPARTQNGNYTLKGKSRYSHQYHDRWGAHGLLGRTTGVGSGKEAVSCWLPKGGPLPCVSEIKLRFDSLPAHLRVMGVSGNRGKESFALLEGVRACRGSPWNCLKLLSDDCLLRRELDFGQPVALELKTATGSQGSANGLGRDGLSEDGMLQSHLSELWTQ